MEKAGTLWYYVVIKDFAPNYTEGVLRYDKDTVHLPRQDFTIKTRPVYAVQYHSLQGFLVICTTNLLLLNENTFLPQHDMNSAAASVMEAAVLLLVKLKCDNIQINQHFCKPA